MKKIWSVLKKSPLVVGILCVGLLMIGIQIYNIWLGAQEIEVYISTEYMEREATISGFSDPKETVAYVLSAYEEKDMDKMLRGCAITERQNGLSTAEMAELTGTFSIAKSQPPSANYWEYGALSWTRCLQEYIDLYHDFLKETGEGTDIQVMRIDYRHADLQGQTEDILLMKQKSELWGAVNFADLIALLEIEGRTYRAEFCMSEYRNGWKLFSQHSGESDGESEEERLLHETTEMEYLSLVSSESDEQDFLRQIGLLDVEADEEEETSEADVDNSETEPDTEEELIPEEQMLPINYSLFSQTGEKTPEKAVKKFYMSLKKQDVGTAVCMGKNGEDAEKDFEKFVDCQEVFLDGLVRWYYHMVYRDIEEEFSMNSVGLTGKILVDWLSPENIKYMEYEGCELVSDNQDGTKEYLVYLWFNREHVITACTLEETEYGWQIVSLSSEAEGYEVGEVR